MQQKSLIEDTSAQHLALKTRHEADPASLTPAELTALSALQKALSDAPALIEQELAFFAELGIDEYIARLAQEPIFYKLDNHTATVELMSRMGIDRVHAEKSYGLPSYIKGCFLANLIVKGGTIPFGLDSAGAIVNLNHIQ